MADKRKGKIRKTRADNRSLTVKDIAQLSGFGVGTVSRVLNDNPKVSESTRAKIMEVISEFGYVPNPSARNLKITDSNTIAVVIKGITNPFFYPIIGEFQRLLQQEGYNFLLSSVNEHDNEYTSARLLAIEKNLSGLIFMGGHLAASVHELDNIRCPYVMCTVDLSHNDRVQTLNYVSVDDVAESARMTRYLLELGHRRLVFLTTPDGKHSVSNLREQGFRQALESFPAQVQAEVIRVAESNYYYSYGSGYEAMRKLLEERRDFTAVYAISDTLAIGALKALHEAGLRVPEDCSLAGFDGIDLCLYSNPTLTSLVQPAEVMAAYTVELLCNLLKGKVKHGHKVFAGELIPRDSTRSIL